MRFTCLSQDLADAADVARRHISSRYAGAWSQVKLEATPGRVYVYAHGDRARCRVSLDAAVTEEGTALLEPALLGDFLHLAGAGELVVKPERGRLALNCNKARATYSTVPADDFPPFPDPEIDHYPARVMGGVFAGLVGAVSHASEKGSGARPILEGLSLRGSGDRLTAQCSDGYRVAVSTRAMLADSVEFSVLVNAEEMALVSRSLDPLEPTALNSASGGRAFVVTQSDRAWVLPTIEGEFPDVAERFARDPAEGVTVRVQRAALLGACRLGRRLDVETQQTVSRAYVRLSGSVLAVAVQSEGRADTRVDLSAEPEPADAEIEVAFNGRFLSEALASFPDDDAVLELYATGLQIVRPPAAGRDTYDLIMPLHSIPGRSPFATPPDEAADVEPEYEEVVA
jgi:DNA polymerase III sliding clamp (beta) subunit (PCNA family)